MEFCFDRNLTKQTTTQRRAATARKKVVRILTTLMTTQRRVVNLTTLLWGIGSRVRFLTRLAAARVTIRKVKTIEQAAEAGNPVAVQVRDGLRSGEKKSTVGIWVTPPLQESHPNTHAT